MTNEAGPSVVEDGLTTPRLGELGIDTAELLGQIVHLKLLKDEDAQAILDLVEYDPEHLRMPGSDVADRFGTLKNIVEEINRPDSTIMYFGVWKDTELVGLVHLSPIDDECAIIGYWTGKEHVGNGYTQDAVATIVNFAKSQPGCHRLLASVVTENNKSRTTLHNNGFIETGFELREVIDWRTYETDTLCYINFGLDLSTE